MKFSILLILILSSAAYANPVFSVKDRLRLHLWVYGLEDQERSRPRTGPKKRLPEEVERALRKI
jgi:hypothetical protein